MRTGGGRFTPAGLQVPRVLTEASFRRHLTSYRRACSQSVAKFALAGGIAHAPDLRHAPRAVTKPPSITHDRPGRPSGSADLPFTLALAIALAAAYLVLAWISTRLVPHVSEIGYLWPAGGLATGVLLVARTRRWPWLLGSVVVANTVNALATGHALPVAIAYAVPNTVLPALAAWMLLRLVRRPFRFSSMRVVLVFAVVAVLAVNVATAVLGAAVPTFFLGQNFFYEWRVWWISDALGLLLVVPLVLAWADFEGADWRRMRPGRVAEGVLAFGGLVWTAYLAFTTAPGPHGAVVPLQHLIAPFLIWAALRFGARGQSLCVVLLSAIAVWGTMRGLGPFSVAIVEPVEAVLQLQIYLGVAASMTLLAAALMTERQVAQTASEEWRSRYEAAVLSSGNLLYDIDFRNGNVVWGGNTRKVLGFFPHELSDTSALLACVHPDDLGRLQSSGTQADSHVLEYRVRRKDGVWLDVEDTGEVVRLPDGRAVRAIGFLRDVSERKRAQVERDRLDAQLREAQKMEALGNMAGGIAHDFNNILGAILGYGEMAAERVPDDAKLRQQLGAILDAGRRGKSLVEQILTFTRHVARDRRPVALLPILREVREQLAASIPANIDLRLRIEDESATVLGDPTQIHQVVMNLATNAAQAMNGGGGILELGLRVDTLESTRNLTHGRLEAGSYAVISVRDSGSGIAPEVLPRIFEPFYTTKGPGRGTGLGLALVHAIVREQRGAIDVTTALGKGSTFAAYLPLTRPGADQDKLAQPAAPRAHGQSILVVDDDPAMLSLAEDMLAELGYEPSGYPSGEEALAAFAAAPDRFDAALSDERMPGLSGLELAARLKAVRATLPVVIATGYGGPDLEQRARAAGVAEIVPKPYTLAALSQALSRTLRG